MLNFVCTCCGKHTPVTTRAPKCECGGIFELDYTPPKWDASKIDTKEWSLFRYREFMAVEGDAWKKVTLGEGMTPIVELEPGVFVKVDYAMPTLSFKDRGAAALVAHMKAIGVEKCVQDSSGNAGNSVAAYCARAGIACEIYVPEGTSPKKIAMIKAHGAGVHVIPGSRDHCADVCRERVAKEGVYYANHVVNPFFYEGTKTYIYEAFEQLGRIPDHVILPLGNGTLFIGGVKALEHLYESGAIPKFPKIIALQSELCNPLERARAEGLDHAADVTPQPTIAEGIAIGKPLRDREILAMMKKHDIACVTAPEDKLLACRERLARQGLYIEHTTAANFAAWDHYQELYGPASDVLITLCGAGIKSDH
ncbi:threonine synthase [Sutterella sp.]|uniref:threonine synthase n=1 Tax=Sutterella sp. TaxID=1981025 RepID=UPI0026DFA8CE|nr:threonine synthase [Sutterella sp.]MDO5530783.1 threonine synthase [Sutterella sp.]